MTTVLDTIPAPLQGAVDAALQAFRKAEGSDFEATGIVNPPAQLSTDTDLELVLCGAGTCRRETFRIADTGEPLWLGAPAASVETAELDPPPGARRDWLDRVLSQHRFVLLLFYRGFW